jgi:2-aminoethylphosphonate-pyruvate transaminase
MLATLAPSTSKTLVISNGVYGERMAAMLGAQGRAFDACVFDWLAPVDLAVVEQALQAQDYAFVVTVHNETTTGRLNELLPLLDLCQRQGVQLLLDAVSSFGAEAIPFEHPALAAVASTGNKCLHGIVGTALVMLRQDLLQGESQANSLYLDLFPYYRQQQTGYSAFTQAVHAYYALQASLTELAAQGGYQGRQRRYLQVANRIRDGLEALGLRLLLPRAQSCSMITCFYLPEGWAYEALHDGLKQAGFVIYAGQGNLKQKIFRIANMGHIQDADVDRLLAAFSEVLG